MDSRDTDALFAAEADMDHRAMEVEGTRNRKNNIHQGEVDALAANGGVGSVFKKLSDEEEPLLGNSRDGDEPDKGGHEWEGVKEFDGLPWWKRPMLYWMLAPFFIMAISFGGSITPRINLILNLICREYLSEEQSANPGFIMDPVMFNGDNPQCRIPEVQSRVAQFTLYCNLVAGLLSAFASPKLGALSDRYGRTKIIALTSMGSLAGDIIIIIAALHPDSFPVYWILVGFALDGLCGSFTTAFAITHAYATDCVPPALRNVAFGYFHGCLFTGLAVGPIVAGFIVKATGTPVTVFFIMLGVHVFFMLFVGFVVPESLSQPRQRRAREKYQLDKANSGSATDLIDQIRHLNIVEPLKVLWPTGPGTSTALRRNLVLLAAIDTMMFGVAMGSMTVIIIYSNYQFGWGTFESSIFISIVNTFRVLCLVVILPVLTRLVRGKPAEIKSHRNSGSDLFDIYVVRVAVFFDTIGYLGYTLARTGPLMILSGVIASIGGIGSPTLQSALTKHVPPDRTGQLLGASGLLHALARVVAPTVFNAIYSKTVGKFTQTVFVCLTSVFAVAFVVSWFVKPGIYLEDSGPDSAEDETTVGNNDEVVVH